MTSKLKKKFLDYLQSRSAFYTYLKMYRDRHLSINPDDLQEFLRQTDPRMAVTGAFTFPKSEVSIYDRQFWLKIHDGWMAHIEALENEEEEESLIGDVDFFDIEKRISAGLGKDTASVNTRLGHRLTFNREQTETITASGLTLAALGQSRTSGSVLLMISNKRGITFSVSEASRKRTGRNVVINSKDFCDKLCTLLGIDKEYTLLECKLVNKSVSMILFELNIKD